MNITWTGDDKVKFISNSAVLAEYDKKIADRCSEGMILPYEVMGEKKSIPFIKDKTELHERMKQEIIKSLATITLDVVTGWVGK